MLKPETAREDPPALAQPLDAEFSWKEFHLSLATQNGRQLELPPHTSPAEDRNPIRVVCHLTFLNPLKVTIMMGPLYVERLLQI